MKVKTLSVGILVLSIYYCLIELTSVYSPFDSAVVDLFVIFCLFAFGVLIFAETLSRQIIDISSAVWFPFLGVLCYQTLKGNCDTSYFLLFCFFVLLITVPGYDKSAGRILIGMFKIMAVWAAIGVILQLVFPHIHNFIISILYNGKGVAYINRYAAQGYYSGFFHQVGGTAFYISAGILAELFSDDSPAVRRITVIFFSAILLLEGKRSLVIFLLAAILLIYIVNGNKKERPVRIASVILISLAFLVLLKIVSDSLSSIKFFEKISYTLDYLLEGDLYAVIAQSGRARLYSLAKNLFAANKMTGIGWGKFLNASRYSLRQMTSVHNIYLQLLCETGIIGFTCFAFGVGTSFISCLKTKKRLNAYSAENKDELVRIWSMSFCGQILFLLFGLVENPLYSEGCLIYYFLMIILNGFVLRQVKEHNAMSEQSARIPKPAALRSPQI